MCLSYVLQNDRQRNSWIGNSSNIKWKDQFKNDTECFNANYNENKNMKKKSEND